MSDSDEDENTKWGPKQAQEGLILVLSFFKTKQVGQCYPTGSYSSLGQILVGFLGVIFEGGPKYLHSVDTLAHPFSYKKSTQKYEKL